MSKIVIYGGSFDPIHAGHKAIINELHKRFDNVYVVPSKYKPDMMFSDTARLLFINKYIINHLGYDKITVLNDELIDSTNELLKTYNLVNHIKTKYLKENDEIYLCIGYDQYENLKNWYKYEELLKIIKLVVINRNNSTSEQLYKNCNPIFIQIHGHEDTSSTKIRKQLYDFIIDELE